MLLAACLNDAACSATLFPKGTLLIAMYGATAGKLSILNRDASTNQAICGFFFNEFIETKYLFYFLMAQRAKMISDSSIIDRY